MKQVIRDFIDRRNPQDIREYDRALREMIQYIALFGLWRAGFYEYAAFYGGTALRILHGLPRFSEDIDFSLLAENRIFSLEPYLSGLKTELAGFGFEVDVAGKESGSGSIESAFIKANTRTHVLQVAAGPEIADAVPSNRLMKVKLEVDTSPPGGFDTESLPVLDPVPFYVRVFSLPDLFAGKLHCVLFRKWRGRVKGRDWYDLIWFLRREVPLHLSHLEKRMRQSGDWAGESPLKKDDFLHLYRERIERVDFSQAINDVLPFIRDPRELDIWSRDFFLSLTGRFRFR